MPTGPKGQRRPADAIGNAIRVAQIATGEAEEDFGPEKPAPATTAEAGRMGAAARAAKLTPERRVEIARTAAAKRWKSESGES